MREPRPLSCAGGVSSRLSPEERSLPVLGGQSPRGPSPSRPLKAGTPPSRKVTDARPDTGTRFRVRGRLPVDVCKQAFSCFYVSSSLHRLPAGFWVLCVSPDGASSPGCWPRRPRRPGGPVSGPRPRPCRAPGRVTAELAERKPGPLQPGRPGAFPSCPDPQSAVFLAVRFGAGREEGHGQRWGRRQGLRPGQRRRVPADSVP